MIDIAKKAAVKAGDFLFSNFGNVTDIIAKGDRNLATNLDKEAEKMIVDMLIESFPGHGILAEEDCRKDTENEYLWVIDPLDGTHNFIQGVDIFGVSIGLWHKDDFVLGVIYMPKDKDLYYAEKGKGAFKNESKITVSDKDDIKASSGSFDSSIRYAPKVMLETLDKISNRCFNIRMFGSSVRALSYLAEGVMDFTVEFHDRPWDFAGGVCIVKEAGGIFCDLKGVPVTPKTIGYIASSPKIYPAIRDCVGSSLKGCI